MIVQSKFLVLNFWNVLYKKITGKIRIKIEVIQISESGRTKQWKIKNSKVEVTNVKFVLNLLFCLPVYPRAVNTH